MHTKSQLVKEIVHEINNKLMSLKLNLEDLLEELPEDDEANRKSATRADKALEGLQSYLEEIRFLYTYSDQRKRAFAQTPGFFFKVLEKEFTFHGHQLSYSIDEDFAPHLTAPEGSMLIHELLLPFLEETKDKEQNLTIHLSLGKQEGLDTIEITCELQDKSTGNQTIEEIQKCYRYQLAEEMARNLKWSGQLLVGEGKFTFKLTSHSP